MSELMTCYEALESAVRIAEEIEDRENIGNAFDLVDLQDPEVRTPSMKAEQRIVIG